MELTDRLKAAIRQDAFDSQAEAREVNADSPDKLGQLDSIAEMLYDLTLRQYEGGYHSHLLAAVWQQALEAVQSQINQSVPITENTVLTVENPYEKEQNNGN